LDEAPHDLDLPETHDVFTLAKLQGGYSRYVAVGHLKAGLGAGLSASIVPGDLRVTYGRRVNPGVSVFLTLRPAVMGRVASSTGMVMVQTALDPAKLTCPCGFDPGAAATATYEGKTYYFCSTEERDRFLTDPRMSLSMTPPKQ